MSLVLRMFRARPGTVVALGDALRRAAAAMLEPQGSIVVCRTDDPAEMVWIGDRGTDQDFRAHSAGLEDALAESPPPLALKFLDAWYRFPAPPCQVWNFTIHAPCGGGLDVLKDLFGVLRWERQEPQMVGRSIYRAVDDPDVFIGFVGLPWGSRTQNAMARLNPSDGVARLVVWRPLSIAYTVARVTGGAARTIESGWNSRDPFGVRLGALPLSAIAGRGGGDARSVALPSGSVGARDAGVRPGPVVARSS